MGLVNLSGLLGESRCWVFFRCNRSVTSDCFTSRRLSRYPRLAGDKSNRCGPRAALIAPDTLSRQRGPPQPGAGPLTPAFYVISIFICSKDRINSVPADYFAVTQSLSFYGHLSRPRPKFSLVIFFFLLIFLMTFRCFRSYQFTFVDESF